MRPGPQGKPSALLIGCPSIGPVPPVGFVTIGPLSNRTSAPACGTSPAAATTAAAAAKHLTGICNFDPFLPPYMRRLRRHRAAGDGQPTRKTAVRQPAGDADHSNKLRRGPPHA